MGLRSCQAALILLLLIDEGGVGACEVVNVSNVITVLSIGVHIVCGDSGSLVERLGCGGLRSFFIKKKELHIAVR